MNWETTYGDIGISSLLQTATELRLIVRLFSVRTPALQLGFGGRKFRLWLEVTLFLFLVHINIYIHILIHLNRLARAWEKAATVGPRRAGAQRRFWCWKVCSYTPQSARETEFWAPVSALQRLLVQAVESHIFLHLLGSILLPRLSTVIAMVTGYGVLPQRWAFWSFYKNGLTLSSQEPYEGGTIVILIAQVKSWWRGEPGTQELCPGWL